jgi:diguanylate cyclase (GGDEF)-like protein
MNPNQPIQQAPRAAQVALSRRFRLRIFLPVALATIVAVLLAALGLYFASSRGDEIAVQRQVGETSRAIERTLDEVAVDQEVIALWDDVVIRLRMEEADVKWLHSYVSSYLHNLSGQDRIYILSATDEPIYASVDGKRVDPTGYAEVQGTLRPLVEAVRGRSQEQNNTHERLPGVPLHPESTVRTSERAVHATKVIGIFGRPAVASAMRIVPFSNAVPETPGEEPLLISIRFLDGPFLEEFSKQHLIDSPRFSRSPDMSAGEYSWPIMSGYGEGIGYLIWRPELPGTGVMKAVAPFAGLATVIVIGIMSLLASWLHRAMQEQQRTIIELQASEAQAQHLALHDALTGLPNRARFADRVDAELARVREGVPLAVLLLDLDRFKHVNDTLGHQAGDMLLKEVASRLVHLVKEGDMVARLGGDEFAIVRPNAYDYGEVEDLCRQILPAIRAPFNVLGTSAFVGVSIGVAVASDAEGQQVDLLRKADIALYRAKAEGRDRFCRFSSAMDDSVKLRSTIEEELRIALASGNEMRLYYQPQISTATGAIIGLEALVRWQHPTLGLVTPDRFIGIAEETGLIMQLGEWVLREACAASLRWPDLVIAVNISPAQFRAAGFGERVTQIVHERGADPRRIELEVTEGLLLGDVEAVSVSMDRLHRSGFKIALDDFGTGYSSLSYLRRLHVDKIKIDRSFVRNVGHDPDAVSIISAMLALGHAMGLSVTAEGVETVEQYDFLEAAGCNAMQGYLFAKPLPEQEIVRLMARSSEQPWPRRASA